MKTFDWKEKYYNVDNADITETAKYYSLLGSMNGTGSRVDPIMNNYISPASNSDLIFGAGAFDLTLAQSMRLTGQGFDTYLKVNLIGGNFVQFYKMKVDASNMKFDARFWECYVTNLSRSNALVASSILNNCLAFGAEQYGCTYIKSYVPKVLLNTNLFTECTIIIDQDTINLTGQNFKGFNNCKFQIGNEPNPSILTMTDEETSLCDNFVARCTAQGIKTPKITRNGIAIPMGNWIFSNDSMIEYNIIEGSEIDKFTKERGIGFGHTSKRVKNIRIVSSNNVPASIAPGNSRNDNGKFIIKDDSITLDKSVTITDKYSGYIDSKIIWLGGKCKLTDLNIMHNLPLENGVSIDSSVSLGDATTIIEPGISYIIRSKKILNF